MKIYDWSASRAKKSQAGYFVRTWSSKEQIRTERFNGGQLEPESARAGRARQSGDQKNHAAKSSKVAGLFLLRKALGSLFASA